MRLEIISAIIDLIENNLDGPLKIDDVALRAGYSKWHLQRLFHDITGYSLGLYIRSRKLTRAAVELQLTGRSIIDISNHYGFESQQVFTRSFRHQFGIPPGRWRRKQERDFGAFMPPLVWPPLPAPDTDYVMLPVLKLRGLENRFISTLEDLMIRRGQNRSVFWDKFFHNLPRYPDNIYGLCRYVSLPRQPDEQEVFYVTAISDECKTPDVDGWQDFSIPEGKYLCFHYTGPKDGLNAFILDIYMTHLPLLKAIRRSGFDIEEYSTRFYSDSTNEVDCKYFVPVT